jgi:electron transfer flavoprotein beta subunit
MKIVGLVKHVPEPTVAWRFADDLTIDRTVADGRLSQLDEYAVEQAVRIAQSVPDSEVTWLTMGPPAAEEALRKALAMGGNEAVHVCDDALHGSDAPATSLVLAAAIRRLGFDLVICGMSSTDAEMSVLPAMLAERLGAAQATHAAALSCDGSSMTVRRETDAATEEIAVTLPAVVSVTDQSGEPRYPAFKAIMLARKKPIPVWTLADLGIDPAEVGLAAAATVVDAAEPRPPRAAGTVIVDDGTAAARLADFLADSHFV